MPLAATHSPVAPFADFGSTLALVETQNAAEEIADGDDFQGCTEAREKRRACFDDRCQVRATCRLWTERDAPGYVIRVMTWRTHWLCFSEPCDYHQPVGAT